MPTNDRTRQPTAYAPPTEPGHYWIRMVDPKGLKDYPLVDNERVVRVVRHEDGRLSVETKGYDGIIGSSPAKFACYCWGPRVAKPDF